MVMYNGNSLLSFVGSSSWVYSILYDQTGNGNHAIQNTPANSPTGGVNGIIVRDFDITKANVLYPTFVSANVVTLVNNGNFGAGTTGWLGASSGGAGETLSVTDNTLKLKTCYYV
jgi:hypothetical protein